LRNPLAAHPPWRQLLIVLAVLAFAWPVARMRPRNVFIGNPFAAITSAPELLPGWVRQVGQWLPPGAGANLLRSTAYFGGDGAAGHLAVLVVWVGFGCAAIILGHHSPIRFAAGGER
jgi:hypothetical protein